MKRISEYGGVLLNHFEAMHRPGDRELATEFLGALNLAVVELSFTATSKLIAVHIDQEDRDFTNNIIFLHQMGPAHAELDALIREKFQTDPELKAAYAQVRESMQKGPGGTPHFGLRYRAMDTLESVVDKLRNSVSDSLKERVTVTEMPAYPVKEGMPDIKQVFVYTDVITTSPAGYGQLIELQVERPR